MTDGPKVTEPGSADEAPREAAAPGTDSTGTRAPKQFVRKGDGTDSTGTRKQLDNE
jgi:hypothetical protein